MLGRYMPLYMKIKIPTLAFLILASLFSSAQFTLRTWHTRPVPIADYLLVMNGKPLIQMSLRNFYLDSADILSLELIKPENNAVKLYGSAAAHGVRFLKRKEIFNGFLQLIFSTLL